MMDFGAAYIDYWSSAQLQYVAWGAADDWPFPEVYCQGNQTNWENLSLYQYNTSGSPMYFQGVLAEYPYNGCNGAPVFDPVTAYNKMLAALQSSPNTYQSSIPYLTNI
jgi:hypothetical protein